MTNVKLDEVKNVIQNGLDIPDNEPVHTEITCGKVKYNVNVYFGTNTLNDINYKVYKEIIDK